MTTVNPRNATSPVPDRDLEARPDSLQDPPEPDRGPSRRARRFAVGGLVAGLLVGGLSILGVSSPDAVPSAHSAASVVLDLDTTPGVLPLHEVAELWRSKAAVSDVDYVSRTHLASTLIDIARTEGGGAAEYAEAVTVLDEALAANPTYAPALLTMAGVRAADHDFAAARDLADQVLAADPNDVAAIAVRGDALLELGDYAGAERDYADVLTIEPSAPAFSRMARLAYLTGDPDASVDWATRAVTASDDLALRGPARAFHWFQLGVHQYDAGDIDGASASLEQALAIDPDNLGAAEKLAAVRTSQGRFEDAITITRLLIDAGPAADLHGSLAELLTLVGRTDEAAEQLDAGLALVAETLDGQPAERRHLAGFLLSHDPALALEVARIDIAERNDVAGYDILAWALYLNGDIDGAADAMDQALRTDILDAPIRYRAGVIAAAAGDTDAAIEHLEIALGINPAFHPVDAGEATDLLASLR